VAHVLTLQVLQERQHTLFPALGQAAMQAAGGQHASEWDAIERDCLSRLHVLRVNSSLELLAGLLALMPTLQQWKVCS
jgi:hypothetical protein